MTRWWRLFCLQIVMTVRTPDTVQVFVTAPLYTVIFLAITENAHRSDLSAYAVLAPVLMSLWSMALMAAGELVTQERARGTLEAVVAAPVNYATVLVVRITAVILLSTVSFAEAWLVALLVFGIVLPVAHPVAFVACTALAAVAMAGTATCLSAVFLLVPSARILQNTLSFPFFLLGGVLVPLSVLPGQVRPLADGVVLYWAANLLRACLTGDGTRGAPAAAVMTGLLGLAGFAAGNLLVRRVLRRVRVTGTLSLV